jgi:hypothetical protein
MYELTGGNTIKRKWKPDYSLSTVDERKKYINDCIESDEYEINRFTLDQMGAYLVHPYEKEQKLKSTVRHVKKIPNERLVKHRETGINIKTKDARMNKNEKMEHYPETIPYYQLIDYLDAKAGDVTQFNSIFDMRVRNPYLTAKLNEINSTSSAKSVYDELQADIAETIKLYKKDINIHPHLLAGVSGPLDHCEIDYTDIRLIKIILKNFQEICMIADQKPSHIFFAVKNDILSAISNVKFSSKQKAVINRVIYYSDPLHERKDRYLFERACIRIVEYFSEIN